MPTASLPALYFPTDCAIVRGTVRYAIVNGSRTEAFKGLHATCEACGRLVIPKCGRLVIHHWAHERGCDCDPWYEPMTAWHRDWQGLFPELMREVTIGPHRADVRVLGGVIEFQHSPISVDVIRQRESFYGKMLWVFDARTWTQAHWIAASEEVSNDYGDGRGEHWESWHEPTKPDEYRLLRRKFLSACRRPVFLDQGGGILHWVKRFNRYNNLVTFEAISQSEFVRQALSDG